MPWFSVQVRLKIGSSTIWSPTGLQVERAGDDPFGQLVEREDDQRGDVKPSARLTIHHLLAAGAQVAVLAHFGQIAPAAPAFVIVGLGHVDRIALCALSRR